MNPNLHKNKIIAEFLGYKHHSDYLLVASPLALRLGLNKNYFIGDNSTGMDFDTDWGSLMKVFCYIETMGYESIIEKYAAPYHRVWFMKADNHTPFGCGARGQTKKEAIYEAVIDFIDTHNKWVNEQSK
jgi:hypothetical protein